MHKCRQDKEAVLPLKQRVTKPQSPIGINYGNTIWNLINRLRNPAFGDLVARDTNYRRHVRPSYAILPLDLPI